MDQKVFERMLRCILRKGLGKTSIVYEIWYRMVFFATVFASQGDAIVRPSVKYRHKVIFQGAGKVSIDEKVIFGYNLSNGKNLPILLQPRTSSSFIFIGSGCNIMNGTEIISRESVNIGEKCLIGARTLIMDSDFHDLDPYQRNSPGVCRPVIIQGYRI